MRSIWKHYCENQNSWIFLGIIAGVLIGTLLPDTASSISILGTLFIRALKLLIVPVITVSMLVGILNLGTPENLGRLGIKTLVYYAVTTAVAVAIGLTLVNVIEPGKGASSLVSENPASQTVTKAEGGLAKVLENIVPTNIVSAASEGNVLGIIFFSAFLGIALLALPTKKREPVASLANALFEAVIWMVERVMFVAPIGVLALIAPLIAEYVTGGKIHSLGESVGMYALTVVLGLLAHGGLALPLLAVFFKLNPLKFAKQMFPALTTAFSTASSAATLPVTLDSLENRAGVSNKVASFVAPLGATVNMDGTAIYEAVAALFIANVYGVDLDFSQQITIFLTATFSAIGAAGIPGAGLIMMTLVLESVGLPIEGIMLIVAIDRPLDMLRTTVNVWGDSIGAGIIARTEKA